MTNRSLNDLLTLLDLEPLEANIFRGGSRDLGSKSVFGGQVIGQALMAGARTIDDGLPHSLHAYFLRPGDMTLPIVYDVDRVRDGRSFAARRVQAIQNGKPILSMIASFHRQETGPDHQKAMPEVAAPEALEDQDSLRKRWLAAHPEVPEPLQRALLRQLAIEFRPVTPMDPFAPARCPPEQHIWFRAGGQLPDDPVVHRCVLAYASDFSLLSTALLPHGKSYLSPDMVLASIDHALWFHRDFRADDWLLYAMDSPTAQGSRGLSRGEIWTRDGRLVASVVQESLIRDISL